MSFPPSQGRPPSPPRPPRPKVPAPPPGARITAQPPYVLAPPRAPSQPPPAPLAPSAPPFAAPVQAQPMFPPPQAALLPPPYLGPSHPPPYLGPSQPPPMAVSVQPPTSQPATLRRPVVRQRRAAVVAAALGVAVVVAAGTLLAAYALRDRTQAARDAVVRISTPTATGTGFFVKGPDDAAYVATAFHVVAGGAPVLVERDVPAGRSDHFVEAYPETEVVAFDGDADLAVLRIKNVEGRRFRALELADEPRVNGRVRSFGFAGSGITRRAGLISKEGSLLSLVKFPVYDRTYARVVRDNAIDGLLVSTDLEPGFSGGPTVDDDGELVGVNVTKDAVHRGQDGAVHVRMLRALLERVTPAEKHPEPTAEEVTQLLGRIQTEYLMLPYEERTKVALHRFVAVTEMPRLRRLIDEVRRHGRDTVPAGAGALSGRAAFGMWAAQLPGKALETYLAPGVQEAIAQCDRASARLASFFDDVSAVGERPQDDGARACDDLALRPLGWDLVAATLQWNGKEREYTVSALEPANGEALPQGGSGGATSWRAQLRVSGLGTTIPVWVTTDYGALRLRLFDDHGALYGARTRATLAASDVVGIWELVQPRTPSARLPNAEQERRERLVISAVGERELSIKHVVDERLFATEGAFACNFSREIALGLEQALKGQIEGGIVVAKPRQSARALGADAGRCDWAKGYSPDQMIVLKRFGDKLVMHRTDGARYPEAVELERRSTEATADNKAQP